MPFTFIIKLWNDNILIGMFCSSMTHGGLLISSSEIFRWQTREAIKTGTQTRHDNLRLGKLGLRMIFLPKAFPFCLGTDFHLNLRRIIAITIILIVPRQIRPRRGVPPYPSSRLPLAPAAPCGAVPLQHHGQRRGGAEPCASAHRRVRAPFRASRSIFWQA